MSDPSAQRLYNLALAASSAAASLAASSLRLVIPSEFDHPGEVAEYVMEMRADLAALEEYYCALMNYSGVSWDVLATYYGVSRQALHRRVARRAYESIEESQQYPYMHYSDFVENLNIIQRAANFFIDSPDEKISDAVQTWQERRKRAGWWRDDGEHK